MVRATGRGRPLRSAPVVVRDEVPAVLAFDCPRCGATVQTAYYGPCEGCRDELRARYQGERTEVEVAEYEPKVNVTPNAVALKDD